MRQQVGLGTAGHARGDDGPPAAALLPLVHRRLHAAAPRHADAIEDSAQRAGWQRAQLTAIVMPLLEMVGLPTLKPPRPALAQRVGAAVAIAWCLRAWHGTRVDARGGASVRARGLMRRARCAQGWAGRMRAPAAKRAPVSIEMMVLSW